jgi:hypothetical protein
MPTIRHTIITIPMGITCGRTTPILNHTRIITAPHTTRITGVEFTTATTGIITTAIRPT